MPQDISTHGHLIDEQYRRHHDGGRHFFPVFSIPSGILHLEVLQPKAGRQDQAISRRREGLVIAAFLLVGTEVLALGVFGVKAWAERLFHSARGQRPPVQVQAEQFAFYFRYPGPDGKFGPLHPDQINESNANFFGLDTTQRSGLKG